MDAGLQMIKDILPLVTAWGAIFATVGPVMNFLCFIHRTMAGFKFSEI